jgi:hypothetical protein
MADDRWQMSVCEGFDDVWVCLLYSILDTPYSILSFSRNRLIEVEGEARDHGPGGEFGEIGAVGVNPLSDA